MQSHPYWQQQTQENPLNPDIEWSKPEQRNQAGRLGIIGGNKLGFAGVAEEMGITLQRTSYSPNIKERLDYSCALFTGDGRLLEAGSLRWEDLPGLESAQAYHLGNLPGRLG